MNKYVIGLVTYMLLCAPVWAQLGKPQIGVIAPAALKFFRVAIIPKVTFKSEEVAKAAANELNQQFPDEFYKFVIVKKDKQFQVAFLIKIMFFEKEQAESAMNFLKENPQYDNTKFDLQVMSDSSY